jgi:Cu2+-exporting ATPase
VSAVRLSKAAYRKSLQNLWWAAGYNVAAIPIAAGALSWAGIDMPPALAAVLMSVSTIVVALNAQLLRRVDLHPPAIDEAVAEAVGTHGTARAQAVLGSRDL